METPSVPFSISKIEIYHSISFLLIGQLALYNPLNLEGGKMKNLILAMTVSFLGIGYAMEAQARCTPGDPFEQRGCPRKPTTNLNQLRNLMFGHTYCLVGSNGGTGFTITKDGLVNYFEPNLGKPNPHTYLAVDPGPPAQLDDRELDFSIEEFRTSDRDHIQSIGLFAFHKRSQMILGENGNFSKDACANL